MKNFRYILLLLAASTIWGCVKDIEDATIESTTSSSSIVEVLEDGRYKVTAQLEGVSMTSVTTRATVDEDRIYDGWCLVFGEDGNNFNHVADDNLADDLTVGTGSGKYSDDSPLIQIEPVTINANGTFTMVFNEYPHTAFMRIVVNLTDREDKNFEEGLITSWRMACTTNEVLDTEKFNTPPTLAEVSDNGIATFGQYRHQSVGLDGIYNVTYNTTSTIVDSNNNSGFKDSAGNWGYIDTYDYDTGVISSVVRYSVNYQTAGGKVGTSTVTGLEETYNENQPDPASPKSTGFPMASYGFVMSEITEETLANAFGNTVDMIRVCSKVQVEVSDENFTMEKVYLIDAAQESRIRSSVLENSGVGGTTEVNSSFSIPVDLGGTINYMALSTGTKSSDPIYFYPNSGGGYDYDEGAVDQGINPQYIIIKGQSSNYDTPGYYKVALKAQYPLDATTDNLSELTYDILRNTSFTVKLLEIDKPGYKTYDDAADPNSPANNISYSMVIESSENRYEVLVSKGTYYTELETSRVYVKGYMDEGIDGCYVDFSMIPSTGNTVPTVYVQSSDHNYEFTDNEDVVVTHCLVMRYGESGYNTDTWTDATQVDLTDNDTEDGLGDKLVKIEGSEKATKVRVYFDANDSGRIRLRIGDILKFIPVVYDRIPISIYGTKGQDGTDETDTGVVVADAYGTSWSDFSYSQVFYDESYEGDSAHAFVSEFQLTSEGKVEYENSSTSTKPELRARIYPTNAGDGNAVLYLRQASDFAITIDGKEIPPQPEDGESEYYEIIFNSQSVVKSNNTGGLFTTNSDGTSVTCDLTSLGTASVDDVVSISISNEITTEAETKAGGVGSAVVWDEYFNSVSTNDGQTLTLSADVIKYDITDILTDEGESTLNVSSLSGTAKGTARQAWLETYIRPYLVTYHNTATSTVRITNVAGDYKEYIVEQTQYPPLYFIDASGEDVKSYSFNGDTSYATVFAVSVWNSELIEGYDESTTTYGYTSSYVSNAAASKTSPFVYKANYAYNYHNWNSMSDRNGLKIIRQTTIKPYIFKENFMDQYNWSSTTDKSANDVSTSSATSSPYRLDGTTSAVTPAEMWLIGADQYADAVIGMVRNDVGAGISSVANAYYAMMELTISVMDIFGDTYTIEKKLCGTTKNSSSFTFPTGDNWTTRWNNFSSYLTDNTYQSAGWATNTY